MDPGNESDGRTFAVPRSKMWQAFICGLRGGPEVVPPCIDDPYAFTQHGGEHAIDRWADDGGRW